MFASLKTMMAGAPGDRAKCCAPGSSHAAELADLPEIPLRRRGRPAGDGAANPASPHELQERRMQANRAAASRSHFRQVAHQRVASCPPTAQSERESTKLWEAALIAVAAQQQQLSYSCKAS